MDKFPISVGFDFFKRSIAHAKTGRLDRKNKTAPHGEVPAHPFMRPAWEATKGGVLADLRRLLGAKIEGTVKSRGAK